MLVHIILFIWKRRIKMDKVLRLRRIFKSQNGRAFIVPLDHGVTVGPLEGIQNIRDIVGKITKFPNCTLVMHKGCIKICEDILRNSSNAVLMHLSASTNLSPSKNHKVIIASVEEGIRMGVDGISVHINIGNDKDYSMLKDLGRISDECQKWGMPLLAMMYARDNNNDLAAPENIIHVARIAMELGADIVKISYSSLYEFKSLIASVNIPIVIAGGELKPTEDLLIAEVREALAQGASGISIGRNLFQSQNVDSLISQLNNLIF